MAVLFLLYVIAEVAAVWLVASQVGLLATLGLLLAGAIVGSWLSRREGGKALRALAKTTRTGQSPHAEVTDSMLVGLGGILILVPGFVTDVLGLLVLLPPTRAVFRKRWLRSLERRGMQNGPSTPNRVIVVDSDVVDPPQPRGERPDDDPPRVIEG